MLNNIAQIKNILSVFLLIMTFTLSNSVISQASPPPIRKDAIPGAAQDVNWPVTVNTNGKIKATAYQGIKGYMNNTNENWVPIKVVVENTGQPSDVTIKLNYEAESFRHLRKTLSLESGAKKAATFHLLVSHSESINISIEKNSKAIGWATVNIKRIPSLTGVLSDNSNQDHTAISKAFLTKTVELSAFEMPEYGQELLPLDTLIINNFNTSNLNKKQLSAISEWVAAGGNLLVFGGPGWKENISGLSKELLPVIPDGLKTADINYSSKGLNRSLSSVAVTSARLAKGSTNLLDNNNDTVIANRTVGLGNVQWIGFDASLLANNADILPPVKQNKSITISNSQDFELFSIYPFNELLARASSKNFSLSWLTIVMLIYLAMIGPVNYLILKKYDKKELAWITIPVIVLIFSLGMYSMSRFQKGSVSALNQINVVELLDKENGMGFVSSTANIFSATKQNTDLSVKGKYLMTDFRPGYYYSRNTNYTDFNDNSDISRLENIDLSFWGNRRFYFSGFKNSDALAAINGGIETKLKLDNKNVLSGTIANTSKNKLGSVFIWLAPYVYYTGEIGPGQTGKILGREKGWAERRNINAARHSKGSNSTLHQHRTEITSLLISTLSGMPQPDLGQAGLAKALNNRPVLFTWNNEIEDFQLFLANKKIKGFNDTLLIKLLDPSTIEGSNE